MHLSRPITHAFLLVGLAVVAAGCGGNEIPTGSVSGRITVNGQPREGVELQFVPIAKIRPAIGVTDAQGDYTAMLLKDQSGAPLGKCRVRFALYSGDSTKNYLESFNQKMEGDPALDLIVTVVGTTFDYDIQYDGELP